MTVSRVTQEVAESVSNVNPTSRVTQFAVEALCSNALKMQVTQLVAELISENVPDDTDGTGPVMLFIAT